MISICYAVNVGLCFLLCRPDILFYCVVLGTLVKCEAEYSVMKKDDLTPKVSIDGNAIRRIREEKKLTQLYVAKVVGVTTDTVSRWENNRYPSIRRENALLLAEALEVDLVDILLDVIDEPVPAPFVGMRPFIKSVLPIVFLLVIALGIYLYFTQKDPLTYTFSASRVLPTFAVPEGSLPVRIRLDVSGDMKGMILRERFPKEWKLTQASPPASSLDNVEGMVRWIIKPDERPAVITYLIQVPAGLDPSQDYSFSGEVIVNPRGSGMTYEVSGDESVQVGQFHWADDNGDSVIDDSETLAAANAIDEMAKLHLSWESIEKIWDAGRYKWNAEKKKFEPLRSQ
ncbi:MAG: XRE family transcriptional regulator [Desulfuromonas sp.]|nr:MAG: XRE family transcriptional regulator [Desulfuromonas sp.]